MSKNVTEEFLKAVLEEISKRVDAYVDRKVAEVSGGGGGGIDPEAARDTIAAALQGGGYVAVNVDDAADIIEVTTTTALQTALDGKAPLASPALTGTPTAPTAAGGTDTTQIATTAFVQAAIAALIGGGTPAALDTLQEIAAALGDDPDFAATMTTALAGKLAKDQDLGDLPDVAAARSNLGLGTAALAATGDFATAAQGAKADAAVRSDPTEAGGGTAVANVVSISQAAYDAIGTKDADTLYVITS